MTEKYERYEPVVTTPKKTDPKVGCSHLNVNPNGMTQHQMQQRPPHGTVDTVGQAKAMAESAASFARIQAVQDDKEPMTAPTSRPCGKPEREKNSVI